MVLLPLIDVFQTQKVILLANFYSSPKYHSLITVRTNNTTQSQSLQESAILYTYLINYPTMKKEDHSGYGLDKNNKSRGPGVMMVQNEKNY